MKTERAAVSGECFKAGDDVFDTLAEAKARGGSIVKLIPECQCDAPCRCMADREDFNRCRYCF